MKNISFKKDAKMVEKMGVINAAQNTITYVKGTKLPPVKERGIMTLISKQDIDGSWSDLAILNSVYDESAVKRINKILEKLSTQVRCTFAMIKYFENYEEKSKKIILILKKAKEFINENSS